jgi:hypothetical protein
VLANPHEGCQAPPPSPKGHAWLPFCAVMGRTNQPKSIGPPCVFWADFIACRPISQAWGVSCHHFLVMCKCDAISRTTPGTRTVPSNPITINSAGLA